MCQQAFDIWYLHSTPVGLRSFSPVSATAGACNKIDTVYSPIRQIIMKVLYNRCIGQWDDQHGCSCIAISFPLVALAENAKTSNHVEMGNVHPYFLPSKLYKAPRIQVVWRMDNAYPHSTDSSIHTRATKLPTQMFGLPRRCIFQLGQLYRYASTLYATIRTIKIVIIINIFFLETITN